MSPVSRATAATIALLVVAPGWVDAQQPELERDLARYLELWEMVAKELPEPRGDGCPRGAEIATAWADRHLREVVEIEGRLIKATGGAAPEAALDSLMAEEPATRFFNSLQTYLNWGFGCMDNERALAAGTYVDSLRLELEREILGPPQARSRLEADLARAREPAVAAGMWLQEGEQLAQSGDIPAALEAYAQAVSLDSVRAAEAAPWNTLCWFGSLWDHAPEVLFACDRAVALAPDAGWIVDSRGLARALTGNLAGAIADFETFAAWTPDRAEREQRLEWISHLRAGRNPFTADVLRALREP